MRPGSVSGLKPPRMTIWERWGNKPVEFINDCIRDPKTFKYARDSKTGELLRDGKGRLVRVYQPFKLFPEQERFIKEAFTLTAAGHFPYADMVFSLPKKNSKSTTAAMLALYTAIVIGDRQPYSSIYLLANDLDQSTSIVFEIVKRLIEANPSIRSMTRITATRIDFTATGAFVQAVAHDYAGLAGIEPTLVIIDELWAFAHESSQRLYEQAVPIPTIPVSGRLVVTFAGISGESVLLERLYQRGLQGTEIAPCLYAQPGLLMYWTHEFINRSRESLQWKEEQKISARPNTYLREVCNQWTSAESAFIDLTDWDLCDPELRPLLSDPLLPVFAGLDCSVRGDHTALAVVMFDVDRNAVRVVTHKVFKPESGDINFSVVEQEIESLDRRFDLTKVLYDPYQAESLAQRLRAEGIKMEAFPQTPANLEAAASNLFTLVSERNIVSYPSDELRTAIANCKSVETIRGFRISKIVGSRKIDLAAALSFAALTTVREGRHAEPGIIGWYREQAMEQGQRADAAKSGTLPPGALELTPAERAAGRVMSWRLNSQDANEDFESDDGAGGLINLYNRGQALAGSDYRLRK